MYLYCGTTPLNKQIHHDFKLGCTRNIHKRLQSYKTPHSPSNSFYLLHVWEINPHPGDTLYDCEQQVFTMFAEYRRMNHKFGDSEWFTFSDVNMIEYIDQYIQSQLWFVRCWAPDELPKYPSPHPALSSLPSMYLPPELTNFHTFCPFYNRHFIQDEEKRINALCAFQTSHIQELTRLFVETKKEAGTFVAPCGTGKTTMTVKAIQHTQSILSGITHGTHGTHGKSIPIRFKHIVICCPSVRIQGQWRKTLEDNGVFEPAYIHCVGGSGTTDMDTIRSILQRPVWCLCVTYMSSHLLVYCMARDMPKLELVVFDEAHHMSGYVMSSKHEEDTSSERDVDTEANVHLGKTRSFLNWCVETHRKRLFLTYTPKHYDQWMTADHVFSMDNPEIFGERIGDISLRECISLGILPDYQIVHLYAPEQLHEDHCGAGTEGHEHTSQPDVDPMYEKQNAILNAWEQTHIVKHKEVYFLHHMIVFVSRIDEIEKTVAYFQSQDSMRDTLVLPVYQSSNIDEVIHVYTQAPRAILVNCYILNEGVDIPITNAVAFMYPKYSPIQITQMLLRAGRWYPDKHVFYVLFPTTTHDDMSGYFRVLSILAENDMGLLDDIRYHASGGNPRECLMDEDGNTVIPQEYPTSLNQIVQRNPRRIALDVYGSDRESVQDLQQQYRDIKHRILSQYSTRDIRQLCQRRQIKTSFAYHKLRTTEYPELPENPQGTKSWYAFLHPYTPAEIGYVEFCELLKAHSIKTVNQYTIFQNQWNGGEQGREGRDERNLPSIRNVNDGYFQEIANFETIIDELYGHIDTSTPPSSRTGRKKRR